ncbi:26845_t:CDS:2, partial [Gigaspora margarita]
FNIVQGSDIELAIEGIRLALKENQKFRKRDRDKRISKHVIAYLEGYFLAAKVGSLEESNILKVSTIQNWI